jgi:alanine racemase
MSAAAVLDAHPGAGPDATIEHPSPGPVLVVDLDAVAANTRLVAAHVSGALMAVVKADGFGHGATAIARTALANGASWLGVTSIAEAMELRGDGITAPVLSWLNAVGGDFASALRHWIDVAVPSVEHLDAVVAAAVTTGCTARIHLHADCGLARDGASSSEWPRLCAAADDAERRGRIVVVGVMGHLACADDPHDPANLTGRRMFEQSVEIARAAGLRPQLRHLAATSATLTNPASRFDLCRVGAGLVGIDPSRTTRLQPALTLTAPVVSVRDVPAGTPVGYGHTHRTVRHTRLALLPLGYADGIPRSAENVAEVSIDGVRCRLAGRVSMDQLVVDVGPAAVRPGAVAVVFGPGTDGEPTVADWATWAGTIEHDIVTGIGARVRRRHRPAVPTTTARTRSPRSLS